MISARSIYRRLPVSFRRKLIMKYCWMFVKPFWKTVKIKTSLDTVKWINETHGSLVRFGDGEFSIMGDLKFKYETQYQKKTNRLKKSLWEAFVVRRPKFLVCVPEVLNKEYIESATENSQVFWKKYLMRSFSFFYKILDSDYEYGNAQVSRPYIRLKDKSAAGPVFQEFKKIFQGRRIVVVEGELTRFGVGNDLLSGALNVRRIIAPAKNAFACYDKILEECLQVKEQDLFILALGPAAKPLALELFKNGNQVLDLGHLDIEYEWFLRNTEKKILIPGKYVNEVPKHYIKEDEHLLDLTDYNRQILIRVFDESA